MDWIHYNKDWLVPAAIGLLVLGSCGTAVVYAENKERNRFMSECLKERKQYECTAMWRAGTR